MKMYWSAFRFIHYLHISNRSCQTCWHIPIKRLWPSNIMRVAWHIFCEPWEHGYARRGVCNFVYWNLQLLLHSCLISPCHIRWQQPSKHTNNTQKNEKMGKCVVILERGRGLGLLPLLHQHQQGRTKRHTAGIWSCNYGAPQMSTAREQKKRLFSNGIKRVSLAEETLNPKFPFPILFWWSTNSEHKTSKHL